MVKKGTKKKSGKAKQVVKTVGKNTSKKMKNISKNTKKVSEKASTRPKKVSAIKTTDHSRKKTKEKNSSPVSWFFF